MPAVGRGTHEKAGRDGIATGSGWRHGRLARRRSGHFTNRSCTNIEVSGTSVTISSVIHKAVMNGQMDLTTFDTDTSPMAQPR